MLSIAGAPGACAGPAPPHAARGTVVGLLIFSCYRNLTRFPSGLQRAPGRVLGGLVPHGRTRRAGTTVAGWGKLSTTDFPDHTGPRRWNHALRVQAPQRGRRSGRARAQSEYRTDVLVASTEND